MNTQGESGHLEIADLPRAEVLAALYNATVPSGASVLHYRHGFMTTEEAQTLLDQTPGSDQHLDYVRGRRIKLVFTRPTWDPHPYEQIAGAGTAKQVLSLLRQTHQPDHPQIRALHHQHLRERTDKEKWSVELLEQLKLPELIKALKEARG